jgi:hypothetical protein
MEKGERMIDLKELGNSMLESAKKNLEEDGELMPVLLTQYLDNRKPNVIFGLAFNNSEEKRKTYAALKELFKIDPPDAIVMVNDSWVKTVDVKADPGAVERMEQNGVRNETGRTEAIVVVVSPRDGKDTLIMQPYHRENGKIVWDKRAEDQHTVESRLLPPDWKRPEATKAS